MVEEQDSTPNHDVATIPPPQDMFNRIAFYYCLSGKLSGRMDVAQQANTSLKAECS